MMERAASINEYANLDFGLEKSDPEKTLCHKLVRS